MAVRRAGVVHDLGRLGVPNSIWAKHGPLTRSEMERVRLHPYLTERMLSSAHALAPLAAIAVEHHERMDGSGYPRGLNHVSIRHEGCWRTYVERTLERWSHWPGYGYADLAKITVPPLNLVGDRDHFCSVEEAAVAFRNIGMASSA